jgi:hypothetical protein
MTVLIDWPPKGGALRPAPPAASRNESHDLGYTRASIS